jgi:hypothetical protein
LAKELQEHNGELIVLVHPFFEDDSEMPRPYRNEMAKTDVLQMKLEECNKAMEAMLTDPDRPPMIILEGRSSMDACLKHCLEHNIDLPRDVYLLPTFDGMGTLFLEPPKDPEYQGPGSHVHPLVIENYRDWITSTKKDHPRRSPIMNTLSNRYRAWSWKQVTHLLSGLGAKDIKLGGKYLDATEDEKGEKSLSRCLGEAYDFLDNLQDDFPGLKVSLTNATFPFKSQDLDNVVRLAEKKVRKK